MSYLVTNAFFQINGDIIGCDYQFVTEARIRNINKDIY